MIKTCVICGKEFEGNTQAKYCSKECISVSRKMRSKPAEIRKVTCVVCGEEFETTSHCKNVCSEKCKRKKNSMRCVNYQRRKREERKALGIEKPKKERKKPERRKWQPAKYKPRKCVKCGKEYTPYCARQKYCSDLCRYPVIAKKYAQEKKELTGLAKDNAEARANGLSYGQWRGMKIANEGRW